MMRNLMAIVFALTLAAGFPLVAMGGPVPTGVDADNDGVDDAVDSCLGLANSGQADADHDGCGDLCDICDPNINGTVDINDIVGAAGAFNSTTLLQFDCNDNGTVDINDIVGLAGGFNDTLGLSGLSPPLKRCVAVPATSLNQLNCCLGG